MAACQTSQIPGMPDGVEIIQKRLNATAWAAMESALGLGGTGK